MTNLIYTSYFSRLKVLDPAKFAFISIAGKAPAGWEHAQYKKLAPSWSIWSEWANAMASAEGKPNCTELQKLACTNYTKRFKAEILGKLNPQDVLKDIRNLSDGKIPVLVCYEKPESFCHRHLVAKWLVDYSEAMLINDAGYDNDLIVREWEPAVKFRANCGCCQDCTELKFSETAEPRCINLTRITRLVETAMTSMLSLFGEWNKIGITSEYFLSDYEKLDKALQEARKLFIEFKLNKSLPVISDEGKAPLYCDCQVSKPDGAPDESESIPRKIEVQ